MSGLSIVIVSWNTRELTLACLAAAARAAAAFRVEVGEPVQLVVVDNGSTDATEEAVREAVPDAEIVALPRNLGFAKGANAGAVEARGEVVLFLNSDARVDAAALGAAWRHLATHPKTAIVSPQLVRADGRPQRTAHAFPSLRDEFVPGWLRGSRQGWRRAAKPADDLAPRAVEALRGAALFVRRRVFDSLGGFAEDYFFYLEETDLCWRARCAGNGVELLPEARVVHTGGASSKRVDAAASRIEYHRSLYHFIEARRGVAARRVAVAVRTLRGAVVVVGLAAASAASRTARPRLAERLALLRWHLAGRPVERGLGGGALIGDVD